MRKNNKNENIVNWKKCSVVLVSRVRVEFGAVSFYRARGWAARRAHNPPRPEPTGRLARNLRMTSFFFHQCKYSARLPHSL